MNDHQNAASPAQVDHSTEGELTTVNPNELTTVTSGELTPVTPTEGPLLTAEAEQRIHNALANSHAASTTRNYHQDWTRFTQWCATRQHVAVPAHPLVVSDYLTESAALRTETGDRAYSPATLQRWVAGINYFHRVAGHTGPGAHQMVKDTLSGIRRTYAENRDRPTARRSPLLVDDIKLIVATARRTANTWQLQMAERRDSALILIGWAGAFRRSELARLISLDVTRHRHDGLHITLNKSKADQVGAGFTKAIPYTANHETCSTCAYMRWAQVVAAWKSAAATTANLKSRRSAVIRVLHDTAQFDDHICRGPLPRLDDDVPLFRAVRKHGNLADQSMTGAAVHAVVRRRAQQAGFDPAVVAKLGGHSLRSGFVTQGFRNGKDAHSIMKQTGHKDPKTLEIYARENAPLIGNAVNDIGL